MGEEALLFKNKSNAVKKSYLLIVWLVSCISYLRARRAVRSGLGRGSWARLGKALLGLPPHQALISLAVLVSAAGDDDCGQLVHHKHQLLLQAQ